MLSNKNRNNKVFSAPYERKSERYLGFTDSDNVSKQNNSNAIDIEVYAIKSVVISSVKYLNVDLFTLILASLYAFITNASLASSIIIAGLIAGLMYEIAQGYEFSEWSGTTVIIASTVAIFEISFIFTIVEIDNIFVSISLLFASVIICYYILKHLSKRNLSN